MDLEVQELRDPVVSILSRLDCPLEAQYGTMTSSEFRMSWVAWVKFQSSATFKH